MENRHGGGLPDVDLLIGGLPAKVELKAPASIIKPDTSGEDLHEKSYNPPESLLFGGRLYDIALWLRPSQVGYLSTVFPAGARPFYLAAPVPAARKTRSKSSPYKELWLLVPVQTDQGLRLSLRLQTDEINDIFEAIFMDIRDHFTKTLEHISKSEYK